MRDGKVYGKLFWYALLASMTASNGYAILATMKERYVDKEHWLDEEAMSDYIALAQSAPGPVAVSGSFIIGNRIAGALGAACSVLGIILPPVVMMTVVFYAYDFFAQNDYIRMTFKGMQAAVCAFIISITIDNMGAIAQRKRPFLLVLVAGAFVAIAVFRVNVFYVMVVSALSSVVYFRFAGEEVGE